MKTFTLSRAADRKALADHIAAALSRVEGVTVTNGPHEFDSRRVDIQASAAGVTCFIDLDGDSTWGVIAGWTFGWTRGPNVESLREGRLFTPEFQALVGGPGAGGRRGHHKATGPMMGGSRRGCTIGEVEVDVVCATINRAMRNVISGTAFELERQPA